MSGLEKNAVVEIEHEGKVFKAIVDAVEPDPSSTNVSLIRLIVPETATHVFHEGDLCFWITSGRRAPARVKMVARAGVTKIVLRWNS